MASQSTRRFKELEDKVVLLESTILNIRDQLQQHVQDTTALSARTEAVEQKQREQSQHRDSQAERQNEGVSKELNPHLPEGAEKEKTGWFGFGGGSKKPEDTSGHGYRKQLGEKDQEIKKLRNELQHLKLSTEAQRKQLQEFESLKKELAKADEKVEGYQQQLLKLKKVREGQIFEGKSHSDLALKYEQLFSTKSRSAVKYLGSIGGYDQAFLKQLMASIFQAAYQECKAVVLQAMFDRVFYPHQDGEDRTTAELQEKAYGELLYSFHQRGGKVCTMEDMISMIELKLPVVKDLRQKSGDSKNFDAFLQEAAELAFSMLTVQPPMIVEQPAKLSADVHEKQYGTWDESLVNEPNGYELVYYRPVLYTSYRDNIPPKKGKVGNKHKS